MRVYSVINASRYELCHPLNQDDFEKINIQVDGTPRLATWEPIPMRIIHVDERGVLAESDSPWLEGHALIFRPRAIEVLRSTLDGHGELLPLMCADASLFMFNATRVIDALDEDASDVRRFSSGRLMRIVRHVFRPEIIGAVDIFKIPNLRVSPTFVTQRFVDSWCGAGLRGLDFTLEWAPN